MRHLKILFFVTLICSVNTNIYSEESAKDIIEKRKSLFIISAETPKATSVVCTKHPETKPKTVNKPNVFPYLALNVKTKKLSGPGANASKKLAMLKEINILSINTISIKIKYFYIISTK